MPSLGFAPPCKLGFVVYQVDDVVAIEVLLFDASPNVMAYNNTLLQIASPNYHYTFSNLPLAIPCFVFFANVDTIMETWQLIISTRTQILF